MYRWRAFESVWSELLKKDQSSHPNLWKAPNYDVHQIWPSRKLVSNYILKKQWLRLSLRTIEYATNTYKKYFYTFRVNQVIFIYGERKKERRNFYRMFSQNVPISAAFTAILKTKLPQCNAIGVRTPPAHVLRLIAYIIWPLLETWYSFVCSFFNLRFWRFLRIRSHPLSSENITSLYCSF